MALIQEAYSVGEWRGSYLGFTYNKIHSSRFGIVRTSTSNRYDDGLAPGTSLKTATVPGKDGAYFFGGQYSPRQFTINFAFDGLTDVQLRELRKWLSGKEIYDLIFDESPYKIYSAAVTGTSVVKHLSFPKNPTEWGEHEATYEGLYYGKLKDEDPAPELTRDVVYKGEGSVQFTCYFPFARSRDWYFARNPSARVRYRALSDYIRNDIPPLPEWANQVNNDTTGVEFDIHLCNLGEWRDASGLRENVGGQYDFKNLTANANYIEYYNCGDIEADWTVAIPVGCFGNISGYNQLALESTSTPFLKIKEVTKINQSDNYLIFDSKTELIYGSTGTSLSTATGSIYNQFIVGGHFVKIPVGTGAMYFTLTSWPSGTTYLMYDYLYY